MHLILSTRSVVGICVSSLLIAALTQRPSGQVPPGQTLPFRYMGPESAGRISAVVGIPGDTSTCYAGIDPSDDCTIWCVGDYLKKGETTYSSRIGAFRLPSCSGAR